jgi:hypothetical protein
MATPRKPNARRGRPPKPKPPKRPASRPPNSLHLHPQRYAIAALDAAALFGGNERRASLALLGAAVGEPIELAERWPEMARLSVPMSEKEFRKAADRLRKLAQWYISPADLLWRSAIAQAIVFAVKLGPAMPDVAEQAAIDRARAVDEAAWAREILLPLIRGQQLPASEYGSLVRIFRDFLSQPSR